MRHPSLVLAFVVVSSLVVLADDQQKVDKEIRRINAMAWDSTARSVVNRSVSEMLKVPRAQLVNERLELGLNYGWLFVAHELALSGSNMKDIAASLKGGKSIMQISTENNANWKQIAAEAKKLNSKIEDNLYKHFLRSESEKGDYDTSMDGVKSDNDVRKQDLAEAQQTYTRWRDRASQVGKNSQHTDLEGEQAVRKDRPDPVRTTPTPPMGGAGPK